MIEIRRILAPIDFSEFSDHAFRYAAAIAQWYGASLTALHVFTTVPAVDIIPSIGVSGRLPVEVHEEVLTALQQFVEHRAVPGVRMDAVLLETPSVHRAIVEHAGSVRADLIVIGTHGHSGFERVLLGSVTEKVLRTAPCPVLVIPRRVAETPFGPKVKRILCPIDFSAGSLGALEYAVSLAEEADAQLTLLHVIAEPAAVLGAVVASSADRNAARLAGEAEALRTMRALVPDSARQFCTVHTRVSEGKSAREILAFAEAESPDLIVMGVHGRSAVDLLVFGSNTHEIIRSGAWPVLAVHAR